MASPRIKLTFLDGNTAEAVLNPRILVQVENDLGGMPPIKGTFYGAWLRLGRPGDFMEWLDTIDDYEETSSNPSPTQPEASDGS